MKWHKSKTQYGEEWAIGDVIGSLINLKSREIMFWRNNSFLGVAFTDVEVGQNKAYFPAISMQKGQRVQFNFGLKPFTHGLSFSSLAINEPDCNINGYGSTVLVLLDKLRLWLVAIGKDDVK